jgi:hypothetical protein
MQPKWFRRPIVRYCSIAAGLLEDHDVAVDMIADVRNAGANVVKEVTDVRRKEPQLKIAEPNIELVSRDCRDPFAPKSKRVKRLRVGRKDLSSKGSRGEVAWLRPTQPLAASLHSVFFCQHNGDHSLSDSRIGRVRRVKR